MVKLKPKTLASVALLVTVVLSGTFNTLSPRRLPAKEPSATEESAVLASPLWAVPTLRLSALYGNTFGLHTC